MGKKRIEIENQRFGSLLVLEYVGSLKYKCQCDCGNIYITSGKNLRNGKVTECKECTNKKKRVLKPGQRFGKWTVIEFTGDKQYRCRCDCGREYRVYTQSLTSGASKQCTVCKSTLGGNREKLEGLQFNNFKVLEYIGDNRYRCECSCGNIVEVLAHNLKSEHSTQCKKCSGHQFIDMKNEKIGKLFIKEYIGEGRWVCECDCGNVDIIHGYFLRDNSRYACKRCSNMGSVSSQEQEIRDIFDTEKLILQARNIVCTNEIDIFIPDKNIAIEVNGDYWHSDKFKDKKYHQIKSIECIKNGIRLIHIFEHEWRDTRTKDILKNMLLTIKKDNRKKIFARNTKVGIISTRDKQDFLNKYHLQGDTHSDINIGLTVDNEIVSLMTFGKPRFNNNFSYELIRYCTRDDMIVTGGAEKLFKYFCRNYTFENIITYCDFSKFNGEVYKRLGFKFIRITEPNYVWVKGHTVLKRYQTQKHKLVKMRMGTADQTEEEIMWKNGYIKLYDSGNIRFEFNNK